MDIEQMYAVLRDFPSDGKLREAVAGQAGIDLILSGLVENHEVEKACPTCGKPKFDYAYFRITAAGRLFMQAYDRALGKDRTGGQP